MGNNKFTWVIKNFSPLQSDRVFSDIFVIGCCKWRLLAYPKGLIKNNNLSIYLAVADYESLPCGWRKHTKFRLNVVNQLSEGLSRFKDSQYWFDQKTPAWGYLAMLPLSKLLAKNGGFLVNNEVKIIVEVDVLQVIDELNVTQPLKKVKREDNGLVKETSSVTQSIDFDGFQVLSSQKETVRRVLRKYPDIALVFRAKNQYPRKACMFAFLSLIETVCKPLEELSNEDFVEADNSLTYLKNSGFKVDWLEKKVEEVKEKKMVEQIGETRMIELEKELEDFKQKCLDVEEELKDLKHKCSDIEGLLENEKAMLLATRASPLTLDDLV